MKKIIFIAALFCSFAASAQKTTPGNYTYIAQKYEWDAGIFKGLGIPSGSGPATFITGQVGRAGALYYDSVGTDSGFYVYTGTYWRNHSVSSGGTWGSITGTLSDQTDLQSALNAKQNLLTNSAGLIAALSDETGTGLSVFNTSPLFVTPRLNSTSTIGHVWTATDGSGNGSFQASAAGISGLTADRIPYASSSTTLADNANFYRIVTPGLQGNTGVVSLGPVALGGAYNLPQNRNFDYASNGYKSYGLEVIHDKSVYDVDSTSPGAFATTAYAGVIGGGISWHSRAAGGSQVSPTQVLAGWRTLSIGAKGYTNAGYFSNSSIAILGEATENYTATGWGSKLIFETTPTGSVTRGVALTLNDNMSATFGSSVTTTTGLAVGTSAVITNTTTSPVYYGSTAANGDVNIEGTSHATKTTSNVNLQPTGGAVTIGTTTAAGIFTTQAAGASIGWRMNNTDVTLPDYSAVGFSPALNTGTVFQNVAFSQTAGGVQLFGFSESGANTTTPISLIGYHGGTSPTAPAIRITASKHNGTTGATTLGATEILAQFQNNGSALATLLGGGNFGIGQTTPTAVLHLKAGTATASTAPLKFTSGTNLTTAEAGAFEYNGSNFFATATAANRRQLVLSNVATPSNGFLPIGNGTDFTLAAITEGQNINVTNGAGSITVAGPTLTKNATIENPTASENMGMFRTPVAITITNTHAVLVGSGSPSVTYQISFGTDITALTNVYTAGQTVTSTTTGTAASGVNDATIPADSWIRITTSAQSGTVGQISLSITYTED